MTAPGVDGELLERFGRLTQEVFEAKWIHSLLVGVAAHDARFDQDRKGAETLLRQRGWDMAEVTQYVDEIKQGIRVVPRPPRESASKPAKRSRSLKSAAASIFGGGQSGDWTHAVSDWKFLLRRLPAPQPADSMQRAAHVAEARAVIAGQRRPGRPARPAPKPETVMHGLKVEDLFGSLTPATAASMAYGPEEPDEPDEPIEPSDPWED